MRKLILTNISLLPLNVLFTFKGITVIYFTDYPQTIHFPLLFDTIGV